MVGCHISTEHRASEFLSLHAIQFRTPARQQTSKSPLPLKNSQPYPLPPQLPHPLASTFFIPGERTAARAALHSWQAAAGAGGGDVAGGHVGRPGRAAGLGPLASTGSIEWRRPAAGASSAPRTADPACLAMEEVGTSGTKAVRDPTMEEVPPSGDPAVACSPRVLVGVKHGRPDARGTRTTSIIRYTLSVRSCCVGPRLPKSSCLSCRVRQDAWAPTDAGGVPAARVVTGPCIWDDCRHYRRRQICRM
jgi:hypothetical protein